MRWDLTVLRESSWYLEIQRKGELRGEQRGEQRGRVEEARSLILRQLTRKLGTLPANIEAQVTSDFR
jgi:predicted transposase YdaD